MPKLSQRAAHMPDSPIGKLVPFANAAKAAGKKVYLLNIGQPDIKTPDEAIKALKTNDYEILSYTQADGTISYREKLAKYFREVAGIEDLTAANFVTTEGGSEALLFALGIIANDGDEIITPEPFYANYTGFTVSSGVNIVPIPSQIENGFALPPIEDFEKKISPKTKGILICSPNNPTGYVYSKEELEKLKNLVLKHDIFLIADEVYREFIYDDSFTSVLSFPELKDHAIIMDSESKRFSMCGARLGALVSRNETVLKAAVKYAQARLSPVFLGQIAAEAAHEADRSYVMDVRTEYIKRRDALVNALNNIDGVVCPLPKGAFYCVAQLPVENAEHFCQWLLESFDVDGETLMMAPGAGFYTDPENGKSEVRLAYVLNSDDLLKCTKIIEEGLKVYPGK